MREICWPKTHMMDHEIDRMYREAKDKAKQIKILADMNCTTEDWIRLILIKRCGVDGRSLPRKKRGTGFSAILRLKKRSSNRRKTSSTASVKARPAHGRQHRLCPREEQCLST